MKKLLMLAVFSVLIVSVSFASIFAQSQYEIPSWVKGVANFWVEGNISDSEFGEGLSFLIDNEIIKVPLIQELQNEITQLKAENSEIRSKLNLSKSIPIPTPEPTPQQESQISVQTDDSNYDEGDIVVVSGNVYPILGSTPVTLQLFIEGSLVDIVQITVAQDGTFSHTIIAEGSLWKKIGDYLVRVSYGGGNIAETEFSFTPKTDIPETTAIFEVDTESHGTFDVEYTIKGGTIKDMLLYYNIFAIIIEIESTDEGTITLDLPRELIRAEKQDGKDDTFIILINGIEVAYQESVVHSDSRVLTINFEEGDAIIQIIGNFLIGNELDSTITVKTDREQAYRNGDVVKITGELMNVNDPNKVSVMVYNYNGYFIEAPRVVTNLDSFFTSIVVGGSMYEQFGQNSIKVFYDGELKAETHFWYNPN
ncbi:MAG: hypothetical protein IIB02_08550 [Thaumarchaeota archaeon]|nr:hypothetical protein [Nitrososphaerota archaeon]